MRQLKAGLIVFVLVAGGCASKAPPSLSPAGVKIWQANEALLVLDTLQHSAIGMNNIQQCEEPPSEICRPLLSDASTKIVIDGVADAVYSIRRVPDGWKLTTTTALNSISSRLDVSGRNKLAEYIRAASVIISGL